MSTPLMGLILPTDGGSANVWDTILDTVFGVIDGHNHTTGQGAPIPVAALNVNADLAMSSGGAHFSLTQLLAVQLTPSSAASVSGYTNALFANSSDNNLYWRNNAGTNVQVTGRKLAQRRGLRRRHRWRLHERLRAAQLRRRQ